MSNPRHLLIVDDEVQIRDALIRKLSQEFPDLQTEPVANAEALDCALRLGDLALVITDYELGWTDGLAVLHLVKQRDPHCPVIMFTGSGSEEIAVEAMKSGLDDYVLKSATHLSRLSAAVRAALERVRERQAQREAEARYRSLFDCVPIGLYCTTAEGQIVDANPALVKILGYPSRESLLATNVIERYLGAEDRARWQALIEREGVVQDHEARWRRLDGAVIWVQESARAVRDAEGQVLYYQGAVRDITERKRHERELEAIAALSGAMRSALTCAEMMPVILDQVCKLIAAEAAALVLRHPNTKRARVELACGAWANWTGSPLRSADGLIGEVMTGGEPALNSMAANLQIGLDNNLRTVACVPLIAEQQTLGVLLAGCNALMDGDELRLLSLVGNLAANAIRRASLYENTEQLCGQLESQGRFITRIMESIPSSLVVIDRNLRVVSANRNFLEKGGREVQTTLRSRLEQVFPKVLLEFTQLDKKVQEIFNSGKAIEGGKVAYRAPGLPTRVYYYRLVPVKAQDVTENVMLLMDDVTEQEELGKEVRRAERHLASVVECANDMVISMDLLGRILTWNRAAERISGLSSEQATAQLLVSLCAPKQQSAVAEMLQALAGGERVQNAEVNLVTTRGEEVPIAWSCSPMRDDAGTVVGIMAGGRDLTERRQLQAQLIHSAKMASLGVMAGGIAHELRNPLGVILATVQLMQEHLDDRRMLGECAQRACAAIQRASSVVESLLKFARPGDEHVKEINLRAVIEEALILLGNQMTLRKVVLRKSFQADPLTIDGNPDLLQQVFTNLILNSCNAMPEGGTLTISTRTRERGWGEILFTDTGCGISSENLSKIFDPFFTTMPVGKGTGLGLSISYSIIQQHRGTIGVESQVGQGTTFAIRLPVKATGDGDGGHRILR